MAYLMSLEGPQLSRLDDIRGQLYAATPRALWRAGAELSGVLDPIKANKWWLIGGLFFGAWLAGSKTGQGLIAKARGR